MKSYIPILLLLILLSFQDTNAKTNKTKTTISKPTVNTKELRTGGFHLINPLLDCYDIKSSNLLTNKQLELKLNSYIKKAIEVKAIEAVLSITEI